MLSSSENNGHRISPRDFSMKHTISEHVNYRLQSTLPSTSKDYHLYQEVYWRARTVRLPPKTARLLPMAIVAIYNSQSI